MVKPREANSTLKLIDEYCRYYRKQKVKDRASLRQAECT